MFIFFKKIASFCGPGVSVIFFVDSHAFTSALSLITQDSTSVVNRWDVGGSSVTTDGLLLVTKLGFLQSTYRIFGIDFFLSQFLNILCNYLTTVSGCFC